MQVTRKPIGLLIAWFCLLPGLIQAAPPSDAEWRLTFAEEFEGRAIDLDKWAAESGSPGHILSSRWPENLEVDSGALRIRTRREVRGGKQWTTGHLWTRGFRQRYGYFEARIKIAGSSGLNNAFWLITRPDRICEIDITEAHYPSRNNVTVHKWSGEYARNTKAVKAAADLSEEFHIYALEWDEENISWFFDGQRIHRHQNAFCHAPMSVVLSTAVVAWLKPGENLNGSAMVVDYVRVYAKATRK